MSYMFYIIVGSTSSEKICPHRPVYLNMKRSECCASTSVFGVLDHVFMSYMFYNFLLVCKRGGHC
jgi:hypothetical protein